jgi:hypothetical protein
MIELIDKINPYITEKVMISEAKLSEFINNLDYEFYDVKNVFDMEIVHTEWREFLKKEEGLEQGGGVVSGEETKPQ